MRSEEEYAGDTRHSQQIAADYTPVALLDSPVVKRARRITLRFTVIMVAMVFTVGARQVAPPAQPGLELGLQAIGWILMVGLVASVSKYIYGVHTRRYRRLKQAIPST